MAVENATWQMASIDQYPHLSQIIVLRIEGDTIVNNSTYSKIYHYDTTYGKVTVQSKKLLGLIRDNVPQRKIYGGLIGGVQYGFETFLDPDGQCDWSDQNGFTEHLLYDFSLTQGDTINTCMLPNPTSISAVETTNRFGFERRNFILEGNGHSIMTEGIGTCIGIFKGRECLIAGSYYSFDLFNYCIGDFEDCNILTSVIEDIDSEQFNTFPNPVIDKLFIENASKIANIQLYSLEGKLISSFKNVEKIEMIKYDPGTYFLKIENNSGQRVTKKIIKI